MRKYDAKVWVVSGEVRQSSLSRFVRVQFSICNGKRISCEIS